MKRFMSFDGIEIAYQEWGTRDENPPVVLHHGFIADATTNWVNPGIVEALVKAGRWVVGLDARGHGASDKPLDPKRYGEASMARDVSALFDLLGSPQYDLVGYSMGGVVAAITATRDFRVRRLIISGVGASLAQGVGLDGRTAPGDAIAAVMLTDDPDEIAASPAAAFRQLADAIGADRLALATVLKAVNTTPIALGQIAAPTLVLVGRDDTLASRPEVLTAAIPGARLALVAGDHLSALRDPEYAPTVVDFVSLTDTPPWP